MRCEPDRSITENFDGKTIDHLKTLPASVKFITEDGHGVQDNATMARPLPSAPSGISP